MMSMVVLVRIVIADPEKLKLSALLLFGIPTIDFILPRLASRALHQRQCSHLLDS